MHSRVAPRHPPELLSFMLRFYGTYRLELLNLCLPTYTFVFHRFIHRRLHVFKYDSSPDRQPAIFVNFILFIRLAVHRKSLHLLRLPDVQMLPVGRGAKTFPGQNRGRPDRRNVSVFFLGRASRCDVDRDVSDSFVCLRGYCDS